LLIPALLVAPAVDLPAVEAAVLVLTVLVYRVAAAVQLAQRWLVTAT
jgi:hypothetical protein